MTYQEEQRIKDAEKARKARKYTYEPVLFDVVTPVKGLEPGTVVVKIQPHGCPRNGTMGFTYVGHPETGAFIGMVRLTSLTPVKGNTMSSTTTTRKIRRDQVRPGMVVRSSHGYDLLITEVQDNAQVRTDDRHVGFIGHLHGNPERATRSERYPASSLIEVVREECKHERYNSRSDCQQCFGRPAVTIARTLDEDRQPRFFLENIETADWDYGPYTTAEQATDALLAYNAGEEVPE